METGRLPCTNTKSAFCEKIAAPKASWKCFTSTIMRPSDKPRGWPKARHLRFGANWIAYMARLRRTFGHSYGHVIPDRFCDVVGAPTRKRQGARCEYGHAEFNIRGRATLRPLCCQDRVYLRPRRCGVLGGRRP